MQILCKKLLNEIAKEMRDNTTIYADEPQARYDNYSRWLISYQKTLDNIAREKEIASKVENLDKLLEEVNL